MDGTPRLAPFARAQTARDTASIRGYLHAVWFGPDPVQWAAVAQSLGLRAFEPTAGYSRGMGFRQVKRTLGVPVPASTPTTFKHWLYGIYRGVEVVVLMFEEGSGSSATSYTGAVARIDPPVFLGLGITRHTWLRLFESEDVRVGVPPLDELLRIEGATPSRVQAFFAPSDPATLSILQRTAGLISFGEPWVTDSTCVLAAPRVEANVDTLRSWLDQTTELAREIGARATRFGRTREELALRAVWQQFGDECRFAFDPLRMKLVSTTASMEIALETEGSHVKTAVTFSFPRHIDVGFSVRRTGLLSFLQGLFSQDINVGSPAFDDRYVVTGYPEAQVRALLSRPMVLAALTHLGVRANEVQMNHAQLFFRVDGSPTTAAHLQELVDLVSPIAKDLFGLVTSPHPFR